MIQTGESGSMQNRATETYAARLDAAITRWGGPRAIAAFSRAMKERGVRGATRAAVHQVLRGDREPSLAFVEAAASVLGVAPGWLAFGTGPVTPDEEAAIAGLVRWAAEGGPAIQALTEAREAGRNELAGNRDSEDSEHA